ncbi:hypothetical protein B0O80DRAFT_38271 [Mortierella sp. GBAus27b]|nr:hypothetical protein B0O80DRAFT_38271 [Mortierella sp. GBAus27b]
MASNKRKWLSSEADGRAIRPRLATTPYDRRKASLVFNEQDFEGFPLNDKSSFELIRANSRYAYFDRTRYISVVDSSLENVLLFLRPRRFGKSLFLSTLAHFHGVENKHNYEALFQGLDVDRDVKSRNITPNQYLIMLFDFSAIDRSPDLEVARKSLSGMIVGAIKKFYMTYGPYLGDKSSDQLIELNVTEDPIGSLGACVTLVEAALSSVMDSEDPLFGVKGIYLLADEYDAFSNEFLDPNDKRPWEQLRTSTSSLLKGFWAAVKSELGPRRIVKCFITGVSPLSMADHTSGFNIATYVSWDENLSGLCGLTEEDVLAALKLPHVCKSEDEVLRHFEIMKDNYDGYRFAPSSQAPHVFNTNTCLEYLQSLVKGKAIDPRTVTNSEVPEPALQILAASPVANTIISDSLGDRTLLSDTLEKHSILYEGGLLQSFRLTHLASEIATSKPAWLSYMLHIGGLTFCGDAKKLRIPNLVAAERFGNATLARLGLRLGDVDLAFQNIINTGNIRQALLLYRQMIWMRDVHVNDLKKTEEHHRDSFYVSFLGNCHPTLRKLEIEAKITKPSETPGRIDMLITVPSAKRILVLEWKALQLDFLDFGTRMTPEEKADRLKGIVEVRDILNLKFARHDLFRPGRTIKDWILKGDTQDNKDNKKKLLLLVLGRLCVGRWTMDSCETRMCSLLHNQPSQNCAVFRARLSTRQDDGSFDVAFANLIS